MKRIFTIFALVILFFFCGSILLKVTVKRVLFVKEADEKTLFIDAIKEKLQFKAEEKIFNSKEHHFGSDNFYLRIKGKINQYSSDYLVFNKYIAQIGIYSDFLLGNKILPNGVIDLGDSYLTLPNPKDPFKNIDAFVQKVVYFKHILDSIGIPLVFALYPRVTCDKDDFTNQAILELMGKISKIGVPVIDLTKECRHSLFYKIDHHWRAKTSIWAAQTISKKLNELYDFNLNVELLDTNNFTEKLAFKWLGSIGRKVISLYEKENFYIYSPKYASDINWLLYNDRKFFQSSGSFDSLYHFIENKETYQAAYPFSFSQNNNLPDGKKILLIGDSYNRPLSKFLTLVFKEVDFIYRRSSLLDDYLANKPDVVVLGFNVNAVLMENPKSLIF
jgi:hypothetical protein